MKYTGGGISDNEGKSNRDILESLYLRFRIFKWKMRWTPVYPLTTSDPYNEDRLRGA